jgi:two-component system LytT family response regulator
VTLRVVIVDDEELARRGVRSRLERSDDVRVVAECGTGKEAIGAIRRTTPDLVFLDVQMPGMNGFEVIAAVGLEPLPQVIFVTAHDKYAIRAFEVHALDYLLKPIDDERFDAALAHARGALARERQSDLAQRVASLLRGVGDASEGARGKGYAERFVVRSGGRVIFVPALDIDWVEAAGDYVRLHAGKKSWLLRETMASIESRLDAGSFARIHRSAIVNVERIAEMRSYDNGEYLVLLRDGTQLKLSRSHRAALQQLVDGSL